MTDERKRPVVLVVDDDPLVLRAMSRELDAAFDVVTATGADAAADCLAAHEGLAAIVCDLNPGADGSGLFVLEVARGIQPSAARVLISGAATPDVVDGALRLGIAHSFLSKPWEPGAILRAIGQVEPPI